MGFLNMGGDNPALFPGCIYALVGFETERPTLNIE